MAMRARGWEGKVAIHEIEPSLLRFAAEHYSFVWALAFTWWWGTLNIGTTSIVTIPEPIESQSFTKNDEGKERRRHHISACNSWDALRSVGVRFKERGDYRTARKWLIGLLG